MVGVATAHAITDKPATHESAAPAARPSAESGARSASPCSCNATYSSIAAAAATISEGTLWGRLMLLPLTASLLLDLSLEKCQQSRAKAGARTGAALATSTEVGKAARPPDAAGSELTPPPRNFQAREPRWQRRARAHAVIGPRIYNARPRVSCGVCGVGGVVELKDLRSVVFAVTWSA